MFWRKAESTELSERERRILELVAGCSEAMQKLVPVLDRLDKRMSTIEKRITDVEKLCAPIPKRQDTLIKLFMEYADRVLALNKPQ